MPIYGCALSLARNSLFACGPSLTANWMSRSTFVKRIHKVHESLFYDGAGYRGAVCFAGINSVAATEDILRLGTIGVDYTSSWIFEKSKHV